MKSRYAVLSLVALATGCGYNSGFVRDSITQNEIQYQMNVQGQRYLRSVSGTASSGSVLCFIPVVGQTYKRAMEELYQNAQLAPNQTVLNLREDHEVVSYFGFYCRKSVTVSGDVVEFLPGPSTPPHG